MKVSVIGDRDTVMGFGLTGIKDLYAAGDREAAINALDEVMQNPDMGVVIITERYAHSLEDEIRKWREEKPLYPLIVEIEDKKGPVTREDPIRLLIKRAVGLDMKSDEVK
ncbi:MAG: V-type ATP synthase subunit F [Thermoplasmata archaeon]|nr:MAG: V-type ATP synthase subunit F [Thermoplasmata archaeon]